MRKNCEGGGNYRSSLSSYLLLSPFNWLFMQILCFVIIGTIFLNDGLYLTLAQKTIERSHMPIGAFRLYPRSTFSCIGRPAGYYADIQTGCQIYHMCDGLGRQFSYSCPNTTLFQQRMLICDHWYMVNCSKAESDYAANLLIGQRDKPFVPEEENQLRTPRPDLLDRPYAPDYSGESFRNQYKDHRQISNEISDSDDNTDKQYFQEVNPPTPTHWHLPSLPDREILPPLQNEDKDTLRRNDVDENIAVDLGTSYSSNYNTSGDLSSSAENSFNSIQSVITTTLAPTTTTTRRFIPIFRTFPPKTTTAAPTTTTTTTETPPPSTTPKIFSTTRYIKPPSRLYEPPFLYPIYNIDYKPEEDEQTQKENEQQQQQDNQVQKQEESSAFEISTPPTPTTTELPLTTTATSPPTTTFMTTRFPSISQFSSRSDKPTIYSGRPFSLFSSASTTTTSTASPSTSKFQFSHRILNQNPVRSSQTTEKSTTFSQGNFQYSRTTTTARPSTIEISTPYLDLLPPTLEYVSSSPSPFELKKEESNEIVSPSNDLLPPFQEYVTHDVATTQGPPIYYEWKIPSNALEPPKLESPTIITSDQNDAQNADSSQITENHQTTKQPFEHNPFLAPIFSASSGSSNFGNQKSTHKFIRTPTIRSIQKTTVPYKTTTTTTSQPSFDLSIDSSTQYSEQDQNIDTNFTNKSDNLTGTSKEVDIHQLQKDFLIPDYLFPLENDSRKSYEEKDVFNSFQLKIPENNDGTRPWYGENPECPECHPSFVKPGTCEPCVRRR